MVVLVAQLRDYVSILPLEEIVPLNPEPKSDE
jgi:hypothetical protein